MRDAFARQVQDLADARRERLADGGERRGRPARRSRWSTPWPARPRPTRPSGCRSTEPAGAARPSDDDAGPRSRGGSVAPRPAAVDHDPADAGRWQPRLFERGLVADRRRVEQDEVGRDPGDEPTSIAQPQALGGEPGQAVDRRPRAAGRCAPERSSRAGARRPRTSSASGPTARCRIGMRTQAVGDRHAQRVAEHRVEVGLALVRRSHPELRVLDEQVEGRVERLDAALARDVGEVACRRTVPPRAA